MEFQINYSCKSVLSVNNFCIKLFNCILLKVSMYITINTGIGIFIIWLKIQQYKLTSLTLATIFISLFKIHSVIQTYLTMTKHEKHIVLKP